MRKNTLFYMVLALACAPLFFFSACADAAGTIEYRYILDGTVDLAGFGVDMDQVEVQLTQNDKNIGNAVKVNEAGGFEISGVLRGNGYRIKASCGSYYSETEEFNVPEDGSSLKLIMKATADITGTITIDDDPDADVQDVVVILSWMSNEKARVHPDINGDYSFPLVEKKQDAYYQVSAELANHQTARSLMFDLTGSTHQANLTILRNPPVPVDCVFEPAAYGANKLLLTFDRPVNFSTIQSNNFYMSIPGAQFGIPVNSVESNDGEAGLKWLLTLAQDAGGVSTPDKIVYNGTFITQKNNTLQVLPFDISVRSIVEAIKITEVKYDHFFSMRHVIQIQFDQPYNTDTADVYWTLTSSLSGESSITKEVSFGTILSEQSILLLELSGAPQPGETLTLSYTKPNQGGLKGKNGLELESVLNLSVTIP